MTPTAEPYIAHLELSDGTTEELLVTPVGTDLYRLEESSLLGEIRYHDTIEIQTLPGGTLRVLQVVSASGLEVVSWILPKMQFEAPDFLALLDKVMNIGGNWERTFGGYLVLHLPPAEVASIVHEFKAVFKGTERAFRLGTQ